VLNPAADFLQAWIEIGVETNDEGAMVPQDPRRSPEAILKIL
jgi:hypothetical protein